MCQVNRTYLTMLTVFNKNGMSKINNLFVSVVFIVKKANSKLAET